MGGAVAIAALSVTSMFLITPSDAAPGCRSDPAADSHCVTLAEGCEQMSFERGGLNVDSGGVVVCWSGSAAQ